jgi:nucleoside 2-deoxyribosyltransferase
MPDNDGKPYVYLAGPDVFYPEPMERADRMKSLLRERGMIGLFPMDNQFDEQQYPNPKDLGLAIAQGNESMMRKADIIIANIQPWHGPEADDGTCFEIGFMAALNKIIVLHTNDPRPFADRVTEDVYQCMVHDDGPIKRGDIDNMMIENFSGFADNLMLVNAAIRSYNLTTGDQMEPVNIVQLSFEAAADLAKVLWSRASQPNHQ